MGREEQIEEREVLESIFPEELTAISETEFRISITLELPDNYPEPPTFLLQVRYPEDYPDKAPHLDILAPPNAPPHEFFSVGEDRDALLAALHTTAEENLGMAMVFTLATTLKDEAEQMVMDRGGAKERRREEVSRAAEAVENAKFHGEPVSRESFLRWREGFLAEMDEARKKEDEDKAAEAKRNKVKEVPKLSGRQLWENGLVGKEVDEEGDDDDDDGDDGDDVPTEGVEKLKVGA